MALSASVPHRRVDAEDGGGGDPDPNQHPGLVAHVSFPSRRCQKWRLCVDSQANLLRRCLQKYAPLSAAAASLPLEQLSHLEMLPPAPGTALRAEIDSATVPQRVSLTPTMELDGVRIIAALALDGGILGSELRPAQAGSGIAIEQHRRMG